MFKSSLRVLISTLVLLGTLGSTELAAQSSGDVLSGEFPELGALFNAFDVTHGALYEHLVTIGESSGSGEAQDQLREMLTAQVNMTMLDMMQMSPGASVFNQAVSGDMAGMTMGPFGPLETGALTELTTLVRAEHSAADADDAFSNNGVLTPGATSVLLRGREFEAQIFDIYSNAGISDKFRAINSAVDEYLSDSGRSVPAQPKSPTLLYGHPFASAFNTGFPRLSGLLWASQWLRLASLEPLMVGVSREATEDGVTTTINRFQRKLEGMQGMSMLPTEIPMVPAISPLLLNRHPEAAYIIDNLNVLETVIADLLAHPDVQDRNASIDAIIYEFTNGESNIATASDYLLSALRTGIFAQGGPALGTLARSERNRSRREMEMPAHVSLPGMN